MKRPRLNLTDSNARIPGDVHGEEDPGRFDRAGIAGAARGYRDRVHVDRDRLCIGTLETDISRIGESPRDVPDIVNAGEPRFQGNRWSAGHGASATRVSPRTSAPRWRCGRRRRIPAMPATFNEPDRNPSLVSATVDERSVAASGHASGSDKGSNPGRTADLVAAQPTRDRHRSCSRSNGSRPTDCVASQWSSAPTA